MAPKVQPRVPNAKVRIEDVITKDGTFDSSKFWKLSDAQIADLIGDAVHDVRTYIVQPSTSKKAASSVRLLEALDKEDPDLGLGHYVTLFKSMESGNGSALTKNYFDSLKQYDPNTFNLYLKHPGWEAYDMPDFNFDVYKAENLPKDAEPTSGALSNNPLNNASPAESASGVLTDQPAVLPEVGKTVEKAAASAYTGKEPPIADYDTPIVTPGVKVRFINAEGKPVDLSPEEIAKFKPNSASTSLEAKIAEEAAKGKPDAKAITEESEAKTPEGALTGSKLKNAFIKMKEHPKATALGLLSLIAAGYGVSQLPKLINSSKTKLNVSRSRNEELESPETPNNTNYRVWESYKPYTPGKIPRHIPQDYLEEIQDLPVVNEDKGQPQVVNTPAPENKATADYVKAAYNSYIPSDAGRAYQKAIYGDPLELDRMRLQQQQQKWRDFVMRSGQSPAELVQRGLMPYDALQYV